MVVTCELNRVAVVIGTKCNFRCVHCTIADSDKDRSPSAQEIKVLKSFVASYRPQELLFTGGEPSLYLDHIIDIASVCVGPPQCKVILSTNGHFAVTESAASLFLDCIPYLHRIQMSFDSFHAQFTSLQNVSNLYAACRKHGVHFSVLMAIGSAAELSLLAQLRKIGKFPVGVQKVVPFGQAVKNGVAFKFPEFDRGVLRRCCPNSDRIVYTCGRGFSFCCAELVFADNYHDFAHNSVDEHFQSPFYKLISRKTFGKIAQELSVSIDVFDSACSHDCVVCFRIFDEARRLGTFPPHLG